MAKAASNSDIKDMSFEMALKELEQIVGRLERGDVELEESITIYERGEALRARCDGLLKQAEARVEKITLDSEGNPTGTEPLLTLEEGPWSAADQLRHSFFMCCDVQIIRFANFDWQNLILAGKTAGPTGSVGIQTGFRVLQPDIKQDQ